jgi:hypothetical protein
MSPHPDDDRFYRAADRFHNPPDRVAEIDVQHLAICRQLREALSAVNKQVDGPRADAKRA